MPKGPVRRAQLIAPFGIGAMMVARDGTSVITAGLDHWYEPEGGVQRADIFNPGEFTVEEWRLKRLLRADHFRLPPDYREYRRGERIPNCHLTVPTLRFPAWHFCPGCTRLAALPLSMRGRQKCAECAGQRKTRFLVQVSFVAMCDHGHLQDFPWREWVHKTENPECSKPLKLVSTGGASLSAVKVICDCGETRTLGSITRAEPDGSTFLSTNLDKNRTLFKCRGKRPWLGTDEGSPCDRPLRGSLRSASNVYFADVRSAIFLPRGGISAPSELVSLLETPIFSTAIRVLSGTGQKVEAKHLRRLNPAVLKRFSDEEIMEVVEAELSDGQESGHSDSRAQLPAEQQEIAFRNAEFEILRTAREEEQLLIKPADLNAYNGLTRECFSRITLVHKLRETRAFAGFRRIFPENEQTLEQRKHLLRRKLQTGSDSSWLPAYIVYGEGLFLELDGRAVQAWEQTGSVRQRVQILAHQYQQVQTARRLRPRTIGPRYVLVHTLAHLIMNRLTFECGYSSASLRERLYVSEDREMPMAAMLIYTAAGDVEGTLGGLVRMGKPGFLEPIIQQSVEGAKWCSADPVCMELGRRGGQGPDSCNLAACHNCALLPETACEDFNRFLDRALVIGDTGDRQLGYFA